MPPKRKTAAPATAEKSETNDSIDVLPLKEKTEENKTSSEEREVNDTEIATKEKERKRKKERKVKSNGRSSAKQSRTSTRTSSDEDDEVDDDSEEEDSDDNSDDSDSDSNSYSTIPRNNEDSSAWAGWSSNNIVQHWLLNNPLESQTFPRPKASTNNFLGSTYGNGRWKWREVGAENVNNWHDYPEYFNAILEYNYRVGSRQFKIKKDNILYEVSLDHRSEREANNHNNRRVIKRD